jgi:cell division protein FtsL
MFSLVKESLFPAVLLTTFLMAVIVLLVISITTPSNEVWTSIQVLQQEINDQKQKGEHTDRGTEQQSDTDNAKVVELSKKIESLEDKEKFPWEAVAFYVATLFTVAGVVFGAYAFIAAVKPMLNIEGIADAIAEKRSRHCRII